VETVASTNTQTRGKQMKKNKTLNICDANMFGTGRDEHET